MECRVCRSTYAVCWQRRLRTGPCPDGLPADTESCRWPAGSSGPAYRSERSDCTCAPAYHQLPFSNEVAQRLFDVHVLVSLAGPDRRQRVPVLHRGHGDHIDLSLVDHLVDVGIPGRFIVKKLLDPRRGGVQSLAIRVTNGGHNHTLLRSKAIDVVIATSATTHDTHANDVARLQHARCRDRGKSEHSCRSGRLTQETVDDSRACHGSFIGRVLVGQNIVATSISLSIGNRDVEFQDDARTGAFTMRRRTHRLSDPRRHSRRQFRDRRRLPRWSRETSRLSR